ncbi:relaxase/mobilization nuclease domain-containing protein [Okeania sp. SIO1I7]|uniref:relaxase/mobilization nuclease domain-containing protein n=1 Tax=Okeania sp. SIO1I7 TaxID=2607772 RepID=UPI0013F6EAD6|nr:relaxase/mobilization nuclease domain-containing protein [Okeania sp. SIO1I7]NET29964.1 relaxase/mobilization nuclease domain-containing protein [Okeania sp. SIO1I7]
MKAKITSGKNFKSIINYVFSPGDKNKPDRADWIGGTLGSNSPQEMIKEFNTVQRLRPDINIKNPSWHCSLTLPKGEYLPDGQWSNLVDDFMDKMKFSKYNPYTIVRHNDTEFDHVHIIASKVPTIGPAWKDGREILRAIAATQELEKEYGLTQTPGYRKRESARATYRERKKAENSGITPPRIQLQELIDEAVVGNPTAPEFAQRLEDAGVIVRAGIASTGRMGGFSFELDGLAFKGSKLGKAYGWGGLQKRGVNYDAERDAEGLERYRLPVEERPPRISEELEESTPTPIYIDKEKPDQEVERERQRQIDAKLQEHPYMSPSEAEQWVEYDRMWDANSSKRQAAQEQERQRIRERAEALWAKVEAEREEEKERARREAAQSVGHSDEKLEIETEPEPKQHHQEQSESMSIPEVTQAPTVPSALSAAPIQEPGQQQQWVENLCYGLADLLNNEQASEVKGKRRTIAWDREQKRLTLRENKTEEVVLDAEWDEDEECWKDNGSSLTAADFEDISRGLDKWRADRDREQERERERQQRSASKGLER